MISPALLSSLISILFALLFFLLTLVLALALRRIMPPGYFEGTFNVLRWRDHQGKALALVFLTALGSFLSLIIYLIFIRQVTSYYGYMIISLLPWSTFGVWWFAWGAALALARLTQGNPWRIGAILVSLGILWGSIFLVFPGWNYVPAGLLLGPQLGRGIVQDKSVPPVKFPRGICRLELDDVQYSSPCEWFHTLTPEAPVEYAHDGLHRFATAASDLRLRPIGMLALVLVAPIWLGTLLNIWYGFK